jgi:hypothetical protein
LRRVEAHLEPSAGRTAFQLDVETTGGFMKFVMASAEFLSRIRQ